MNLAMEYQSKSNKSDKKMDRAKSAHKISKIKVSYRDRVGTCFLAYRLRLKTDRLQITKEKLILENVLKYQRKLLKKYVLSGIYNLGYETKDS
jgi:hypothetical protein